MKPFDLQVNGYAGTDFCSLDLTGEQLNTACQALEADGVDSILATVITDSVGRLEEKLRNLVELREKDPLAQRMITGFHVEGPFLSPEPGFIGAHPVNEVKRANGEDARRLFDASGGLIRLFTLAPEMDAGGAVTRYLTDLSVVVSAGHTNASLDELHCALDQGLSMVTHLGNGCPVSLPRHDNIVQRVLSLRDRLWTCFIADGHHVDFFALRNYLDLVGVDRAIMVTDSISAATMGPGTHTLSGSDVEVDAEGVARRPGSPNLAGSTLTMPRLQENLREYLGMSDSEIRQLIDLNPRNALKREIL